MVNLVDTPGHVDFSGKVTRAMRAIDGAVIVVDAVEEVMAQTENVLRTAIQERVHPVLFINKLDRLIRELKLSPTQIQEKLTRIIDRINNLITELMEDESAASWQVNAELETVAFGSALHKWGFTVRQMRDANLRFQDVLEYYQKDQVDELAKRLPIHTPILNMILEHLPSPKKAQSYRINHIWRGDLSSIAGLALRNCDKESPLVIGVTKVVDDPRHDHVAVGRVFSGTVRRGTMVRLFPNEDKLTVQRVSLFMGPRRIVVSAVPAGNICGLVGLDDVKAGDTITGIAAPSGMVPFEEIRYITEPVVTIAIEPKRPRALPRLLSFLTSLTKRDPNLISSVNEETGEYLLSGIGLLHLEIAIKEIEKEGITVETSEPIVLYRETPKRATMLATAFSSPNKENWIRLAVRPRTYLEQQIEEHQTKVWFQDKRNNNLIFSVLEQNVPESAQAALISGFVWACERGPLCGEPVGSTIVQIVDLELSEHLPNRGRVELMSMMKEAIFKAFEKSEMTLLEPTYEIQVIAPNEYLREITGVILSRRGKVNEVEHKGALVSTRGVIPVSESFDLATTIRSQTSGRALWQTRFASWQNIPESRVEQIVSSIRKRKGWRAT